MALIIEAARVVLIRESSSLIGFMIRMALRSTASSGSFNISKSDGEKKEYLLAEHKDLEDPAQTVALKEPEEPQEPDKPLTPEKPEKPEKPVEPEKPVNPEKPEKVRRKSVKPASPVPVRSGSAVKTGDNTNPAVYLIPALLSGLAIAGILLAKFKMKADRK